MGRTGDAVSALRSAAESYSAAEFKSWAGYSRVLAAETLLLAERPSEALEELVIALQLLEGSESEHELWAAVKLLHSAVAATKPTASEMRSCREKLERIRKSHF